ncbi:TM1812 family CRISPR-associated protein [Sulfurimonas sp. RIFOXYB12_FULL_35_9]|uniref:CRISPR-associated DxTHG motif protein n=1 Tax=Sulfurimonas sp. RIFOXYB12_FULL_35_9 TaxID=1802256 RepID=UPI0008C15008|nr:TM1812 family CRISPR-associated protein [Sulfurimonas sp. RIFOXYB12_FULL_35_9]OHE05238.1 MAG: hypothetical protein A2345_12615 [Sulfurimonas sp. RIFOXYB12_FULL_35_9]
MKIISILGLAGTDRDGSPLKSLYRNETSLPINEGNYLNSTDVLIQNIDADFFLIGSKEAIAKQQLLLQTKSRRIQWQEFDKDDLSDIFKLVLELTDTDYEELVIDLTHGLRHQPIMAAFAAFIRTVLSKQKIKLLFAAETYDNDLGKHYRYVFLDDYIDHAAASFTLSSFVKTLSAPSDMYDDPLIDALYQFSRELFSNHLSALFTTALPSLEAALTTARISKDLAFLDPLIEQALEIVEDFKKAKQHSELYRMYLDLAEIMFRFNYPLLAATYLYEGTQLYFYYHFLRLKIIQSPPEYDVLSAIKSFVLKGTISSELTLPHHYFYCMNAEHFKKMSATFESIREIRNNTAHLNINYTHDGLHASLANAVKSCNDLFITQDVFSKLTSTSDPESKHCREDKVIFMKISANFFDDYFGIKLNRQDPIKHASRLNLIKRKDFDALAMSKNNQVTLSQALGKETFHKIMDYAIKIDRAVLDTVELNNLIRSYKSVHVY